MATSARNTGESDMAAIKHKGMTDGVTSEWTIFAKVKPGQLEALREYGKKRIMERDAKEGYRDDVINVGTVHDYRFVIFDNGTRLLFTSNFDGDWSQYIDDFFATKVVEKSFDDIYSFCEGYPGRNASHADKKAWFQAQSQEAISYVRAYPGAVKEIWKALEVQKAFQHVLDDPAAVKALTQIPALKPLLDLAAK